jgi:predicted transposase YdaD
MAAHDESYRLLFSHPRMVADLLQGFVREPWVEDLDFSTLERVNASYVSEHLKGRHADLVWRVRWGGESWLYVYLLLEFQSTVDPFMAVRMLVYVGLLYQDLLRRRELTPAGRLPPVVPMLLYNGSEPWLAPREVSELIEAVPGALAHFRPQLSYLLLDEGRIPGEELPGVDNLAAALMRLEQSRRPEEVTEVLGALVRSPTGAGEPELRRAFVAWIRGALVPARHWEEISRLGGLQEVLSMLEQTVKTWFKEAEEKGLQQGLEQGLRAGEARLLVRLIGQRFGPLPPAERARIEAADAERLLRWGERVLVARSLDEVFAD